jgi:hypothetical protein
MDDSVVGSVDNTANSPEIEFFLAANFGDCTITAVVLREDAEESVLFPGLNHDILRMCVSSDDLDYEVEYNNDPKLFNYRLLVNLLEVRTYFKPALDFSKNDTITYEGGVFTINGEKVEF